MTGNGISLFAAIPRKTVIHPTALLNYFPGEKQMGHDDGHLPPSGIIP
jgi:hypothetical protein